MIDPQTLIDPMMPAAESAPLWFVQFFKVLGFALHLVPMNLFYAGVLLAMLFALRGGGQGRRCSARLMGQMPVIIALGINFGIVPLLFMQLGYYKFFYPATILMAWSWLAVVGLLMVAYYGVYVYAIGLRSGSGADADDSHEARESLSIRGAKIGRSLSSGMLHKASGWIAAGCFLLIGFLFANGMSLMGHVDRWGQLWEGHSKAGAAMGTALNVGDASMWPRWLLLFGLALCTTAVWMLVDAAWFARKESDEYRRWVCRTAPILYGVGALWFAAAGSWYVFGTWSEGLRQSMFGGWRIWLTMATAAAPVLPWALIMARRHELTGRGTALVVAAAQFGVLAVNAISRQVVQNLDLAEYFDWPEGSVREWSPMVLFLVTFVVGAAVVVWMIVQVVRASGHGTNEMAGG